MKLKYQDILKELSHPYSFDHLRRVEWLLLSNYEQLDINIMSLYLKICRAHTTNHLPKGDFFCLEGLYGRFSKSEIDFIFSNISNTIEQSKWESNEIIDSSSSKSATNKEELLNTRQLRFGLAALYGALNSAHEKKAMSIVDFGGGTGIDQALVARRLLPHDIEILYIVIDFPFHKPHPRSEPEGIKFVHTMEWDDASKHILEQKGNISVDLLACSGVLQYLEQEAIDKLIGIAQKSKLLFLDRTPVTCNANSFYTIQNYPRVRYKHKVFSRSEIINTFGATGLDHIVMGGDSPEEILKYLDTQTGNIVEDGYYQNFLISRGLPSFFYQKMHGI